MNFTLNVYFLETSFKPVSTGKNSHKYGQIGLIDI